MGELCLAALHATDQHVGDRTLPVETVAKVSIHPLERPILLIVPHLLEIIEFLQLHRPYPSVKLLGVGEVRAHVDSGLVVVEGILVLRVSEVPEHVLGIAGKLLEVEQLVEAELLDEPLLVLLRNLHLYLVVVVQVAPLLLNALAALEVRRMRQHGPRYRQPLLNGISGEKGQRVLVIIDGQRGRVRGDRLRLVLLVRLLGPGLRVVHRKREDIFLELRI
jgi:hypothetical protein